MEIFLERFFGSTVRRFIGHIWILLVARTPVVFGSVRLPIAQAHPAKVVLATVALHMITAAVLLYANLALGTHLEMGFNEFKR